VSATFVTGKLFPECWFSIYVYLICMCLMIDSTGQTTRFCRSTTPYTRYFVFVLKVLYVFSFRNNHCHLAEWFYVSFFSFRFFIIASSLIGFYVILAFFFFYHFKILSLTLVFC
jgi:hypothetical protein